MNCEAMTKRLGMTFSNARRWLVAALWVLAGAGGGCAPEGTRPQTVGAELGAGSYERWAASLPREPESGLAIVDTDLVVGSDRLLRDYYLRYVSPNRKGGLIVDQVNGRDDLWPASRTHDLTYCVSNTFGAAKARVVAGLRDAAASWQGAADVGYRYVPAEDVSCEDSRPSSTYRSRSRDVAALFQHLRGKSRPARSGDGNGGPAVHLLDDDSTQLAHPRQNSGGVAGSPELGLERNQAYVSADRIPRGPPNIPLVAKDRTV